MCVFVVVESSLEELLASASFFGAKTFTIIISNDSVNDFHFELCAFVKSKFGNFRVTIIIKIIIIKSCME